MFSHPALLEEYLVPADPTSSGSKIEWKTCVLKTERRRKRAIERYIDRKRERVKKRKMMFRCEHTNH